MSIKSRQSFPTLVRYPIPHHLVCFSQQRVKWLSSPFPLRCNSRNSKCSNKLSTDSEVMKIMIRCLSCFTHKHNFTQNTNKNMAPAPLLPTCMRSIESDKLQALWMRWVCSMYSDILCRKLSGSLNTTGIAILDSSCECTWKRHTNKQANEQIKLQWWTLAWTSRVTLITSLTRLLRHIFNQNPFCPDSFWSHVPIFFSDARHSPSQL